ncbi:MAG: hypothetical protein EP330_06370 [Deltaproteobacteria bacterium]|nr:MAG: hypothetical protein EP330_06370 [Deltaproteobacteria bacterium]
MLRQRWAWAALAVCALATLGNSPTKQGRGAELTEAFDVPAGGSHRGMFTTTGGFADPDHEELVVTLTVERTSEDTGLDTGSRVDLRLRLEDWDNTIQPGGRWTLFASRFPAELEIANTSREDVRVAFTAVAISEVVGPGDHEASDLVLAYGAD